MPPSEIRHFLKYGRHLEHTHLSSKQFLIYLHCLFTDPCDCRVNQLSRGKMWLRARLTSDPFFCTLVYTPFQPVYVVYPFMPAWRHPWELSSGPMLLFQITLELACIHKIFEGDSYNCYFFLPLHIFFWKKMVWSQLHSLYSTDILPELFAPFCVVNSVPFETTC